MVQFTRSSTRWENAPLSDGCEGQAPSIGEGQLGCIFCEIGLVQVQSGPLALVKDILWLTGLIAFGTLYKVYSNVFYITHGQLNT